MFCFSARHESMTFLWWQNIYRRQTQFRSNFLFYVCLLLRLFATNWSVTFSNFFSTCRCRYYCWSHALTRALCSKCKFTQFVVAIGSLEPESGNIGNMFTYYDCLSVQKTLTTLKRRTRKKKKTGTEGECGSKSKKFMINDDDCHATKRANLLPSSSFILRTTTSLFIFILPFFKPKNGCGLIGHSKLVRGTYINNRHHIIWWKTWMRYSCSTLGNKTHRIDIVNRTCNRRADKHIM